MYRVKCVTHKTIPGGHILHSTDVQWVYNYIYTAQCICTGCEWILAMSQWKSFHFDVMSTIEMSN